jgi:protein-S-isoprenylcysteine O-methyltransferase Ste14
MRALDSRVEVGPMTWLLVRLAYLWASHLFVLVTLYRRERAMWVRTNVVECVLTALLLIRVLPLPTVAALPVEVAGMVLVVLPYPFAAWARRALGQSNWEAPRSTALPGSITSKAPHSLVQHPLYVAMFLGTAGQSMIVGSWLSAVLVVLFAALAYMNAVHDERKIMSSPLAETYSAYAKRVRSRFIPYLL